MSGRNNFPKKKGPISHPSRLDQFGDEFAEDHYVIKQNMDACEQKPKQTDK